ncbi:hypothetical protein P5673_007151 [Acropora cervicornis]|uniref:Uncharacterized protein n=1 Tax=Acropora cervicornis TaxID=6130 RepID=A0AAD9QVK4_ACRCE|nr:hypothetical protein P5673_007151 [Acropora cervicornis]
MDNEGSKEAFKAFSGAQPHNAKHLDKASVFYLKQGDRQCTCVYETQLCAKRNISLRTLTCSAMIATERENEPRGLGDFPSILRAST